MALPGFKDTTGLTFFRRYGLALAAVGLVLCLSLLLNTWIRLESTLLLSLVAVIVSTWYGGLGPGLLATALATLVNIFFFLTPIAPFSGEQIGQAVPVGLFFFAGVLASMIGTQYRRADTDHVQHLLREQKARTEAEHAAARAHRLQMVTATALMHVTDDTLLDALLNCICTIVPGEAAMILLRDSASETLVTRAAIGFEESVQFGFRVPINNDPVTRIVATRQPLVINDINNTSPFTTFFMRTGGIRSLLGAPLIRDNQVIGVLYVGAAQPRHFSVDDAQFLQTIAEHVTIAIKQAQLYEAESTARSQAEKAQRHQAFLAEASARLTASLDCETVLKQMARLAVAALADWCIVYMVEADGSAQRFEVDRNDLLQGEHRQEVLRRTPLDLHAAHSIVARVIRTGQPEFVPEVSVEWLKSVAYDAELFQYIHELSLTSLMIVPLQARDRVLGAIACVSVDSYQRYDQADLALAEALAHRAAAALDNALLYQEVKAAMHKREVFLSPPSG